MKHNGKKVIFVDLDDTLEDFCAAWIDKLNELYKGNYSVKDIQDWKITNIYPELDISDKLEAMHSDGFWEKVKPLSGAPKYLKKLQEEGYDVFIVTATDYRNLKSKIENIISKYFPFIDNHHIITTYYKSLLNGDIMIDDYKPNLIYGDYKKILFTTYHNKNDNDVYPINDVHRAQDWKHCYKLIHELIGEAFD